MASDWQRALIALTATVVTIAIVAVLYRARSIFIPVALAISLAFVLGPVVAWLQRRGLGRTLAVCSAVGLVPACRKHVEELNRLISEQNRE
jgi:predicted PurR-regulated permease PerM